uniref:S1-like domain-containing protein n=1 Tax=viral metagenome TaxID=1070528 RepID=A0A6C0F1R4_9ZZZZ
MVKNVKGGSKGKSIARKNVVHEHASRDPEPSNEFEFIAKVDKMLGNGMCHVIDVIDRTQYLCYIRGKFRGRQKSHNMVGTNSFVLVGKRPWQSDDKRECDLLCILQQKYGDFEEDGDGGGDRAIVFTDKVDEETDELIPKQSNKNAIKDDEDEINFDDI